MGYSAESAFNPIDEGDKLVTRERSSLDAIKQFGRDVRDASERSELVNALNDDMKDNLVGALQKELGDEGMAALERGDTRPLASILPSEFERLAVTQEYLKLAAKELKAPELENVARDLQGDKVTALANERAAEQKRTLGNQQNLDDDMGL